MTAVKKYLYHVTYLIDIVSKNPEDYTRTVEVQASDEADAVREAAKSMTLKTATSNLTWIDSLKGTAEEIRLELIRCNYVIGGVKKLK